MTCNEKLNPVNKLHTENIKILVLIAFSEDKENLSKRENKL